MIRLLPLAIAALELSAQPTLYTCMSSTRDYVVGAKLPMSGVFYKHASNGWQHAGFNHPLIFGLDFDPADPSIIYLAAGNGLFRATDRGHKWKLLTGADVTELRDVAIDPQGAIYFAHSHGIRLSRDRGAAWQEIAAGLHRKFTETVRIDRTKLGVVLAGGEEGIFRSGDYGANWTIAGAAGFMISRLAQSPHAPCEWLATTQQGGLFGSQDCGKSFENIGRIGVGSNLYDVAFDPSDPKRIAVVGWGPGVSISEDRGKTWQLRNAGLPAPHVISVAFDPAKSGRLFAGIHDEGIYVSTDFGRTWTRDGLEGSAVTRMQFIP